MAWVVDVSRCLGLVEIKGCSATRLATSTDHVSESSSGATDDTPVTNDVTSIVGAGASSLGAVESLETVTNSGSSSASSVDEMDSQDEKESVPVSKDPQILNRFGSVSTPCLLDIARLRVLCSPNEKENRTSPARSFSTDNPCTNSVSHIDFYSSKNPLSQSCEVLSPSPSSKLLERLRYSSNRHVILSKGDCTVQYSPITAPASVHTTSGPGTDLCDTPRSSTRKYSCTTSPDARAAVRSTLMDRVCGVGSAAQTGVPPMPATEHPTRPPRIDLCCSQHFESTCLSDRTHNRQLDSSLRSRATNAGSRRAVKSASGLPQSGFSTSVRTWSEYWLSGDGADSSQIIRQFQENRTSSLRGPPSRAASAGILLNSLDLSDVSVGDHCGEVDPDDDSGRQTNANDGSCRIPIPCDCCNASSASCSHDQPCSSCNASCSYSNVHVLGSNSRQSVASTSSTTISSSLDSSNTSVTTISYGGPTQHPSLTSYGSETTTCGSDTRNLESCSCDVNNRSNTHASSCLVSANSTAPPKIRRCQSDVTSSIKNLNNAGRSGRSSQENKLCAGACDRNSTALRLGNRARLSATGRAMTDSGSGVRCSERRSEDETACRNKSLKRSQASTHLRRSVSQPLDLNKSPGEGRPVSTLRVSSRPVSGVAAHLHSYPHKRPQRRPSTGNLLNDDHTTSEEELLPSDTEEARKERPVDESCGVVYAEALWDHVTMDSEELMFRAGELISVVDRTDHDWWWGRISSRCGWFPVAFVRLLVNQQEHLASSQELSVADSRDDLDQTVDQSEPNEAPLDTTLTDADASCKVDVYSSIPASSTNGCSRGYGRAVSQYSTGTTPRKASVSGPTHDQIRANVIKEIITTERDFVKHLRDVVEGYLKQARRRPDMFSAARISAIFGNMEELFAFQTRFLADLEACIDWEALHKSCVGEAFIKNSDKFEIYSEYCNNHPFAVSELQELYQQEKYIHFFEACRLLQEMIDISLDGFLLTPVQKICKYPLQLQELLKYTKPDHPDHGSVQGALNAMRTAALLVNERRRRMECLEKIAAWQMDLEGWEGAELLDSSSQLLHQGEVVKGAGGAWPKEVTLFLFDHQLVYCKKDIIKRNTYVYRGRINLDQCTVEDIGESRDGSRSNYVPNAWRIRCKDKNKSYVFACKTSEEKTKWLEAFRRERELVAGDEEAGFLVSDKTRELAREAARTRRTRPKKPRSTKVASKRCQALTHAQAEMLVNIDREQRSNSLPSHQQQQLQQQQLGTTAPLSATIVSADTSSDNKRRGLWFGFGGQKKSRSQSRGGEQQPSAQQQPTLV